MLVLEAVLRRGAALVPGRCRRPRGAGAAPELQLVAVVVGTDDRVLVADLAVRLDHRVLEEGVIGRTGSGVLADVVLTPATPEPEAVLDRGAAGLEAEVLDLADASASQLGLPVGRVELAFDVRLRRLEAAAEVACGRRVVEPRRTPELVRAPLGDQVDLDAGAVLRDIGAAGREGHLGELIEVVVGRRSTSGAHVRDLGTVHLEVVLIRGHACSAEVRLLAGLVAADVDPVDDDARGLRQDRPGVARSRDLLEFDLADVRAALDLPLIEQRALGGDGDRLLERRGDGQRDVRVLAQPDDNVRVLQAAEAVELRLDGVAARIERQDPEAPLGVRELDTVRADAAYRDLHAR